MEQPPAPSVVDATAIPGPVTGAGGCPFDHGAVLDATAVVPERSAADRAMRRLLRLPVDAPPTSILGSEQVFGRSIAVSAVRCLLTYVALPLLAPVVDLTGGVSRPVVGLLLSIVSMVAIVVAMRRFFGSDHRYRWGYATIGGAIFGFMAFSAVLDVESLVSSA